MLLKELRVGAGDKLGGHWMWGRIECRNQEIRQEFIFIELLIGSIILTKSKLMPIKSSMDWSEPSGGMHSLNCLITSAA